MKVKKIFNNNVVVVNENGNEKIVMGLGIGFQKKVHDPVDQSKVEKVFVIEDTSEYKKFQELLNTLPEEHIHIAEEVISYAEKTLNMSLNEHIHIALTDHLSFAFERLAAGIPIQNKLLNEIKVLYKEEYKIGLWAKQLIKEKLGIEIPEDEAGYIALHIHTAKMNAQDMTAVLDITTMIREMIETIEEQLDMKIEEESISYQRLVSHLRFALQRLMSGESFHDLDPDILQVIKKKYKKAYQCAKKVGKYMDKEYRYRFPEQELGYIALHIQRIYDK